MCVGFGYGLFTCVLLVGCWLLLCLLVVFVCCVSFDVSCLLLFLVCCCLSLKVSVCCSLLAFLWLVVRYLACVLC